MADSSPSGQRSRARSRAQDDPRVSIDNPRVSVDEKRTPRVSVDEKRSNFLRNTLSVSVDEKWIEQQRRMSASTSAAEPTVSDAGALVSTAHSSDDEDAGHELVLKDRRIDGMLSTGMAASKGVVPVEVVLKPVRKPVAELDLGFDATAAMSFLTHVAVGPIDDSKAAAVAKTHTAKPRSRTRADPRNTLKEYVKLNSTVQSNEKIGEVAEERARESRLLFTSERGLIMSAFSIVGTAFGRTRPRTNVEEDLTDITEAQMAVQQALVKLRLSPRSAQELKKGRSHMPELQQTWAATLEGLLELFLSRTASRRDDLSSDKVSTIGHSKSEPVSDLETIASVFRMRASTSITHSRSIDRPLEHSTTHFLERRLLDKSVGGASVSIENGGETGIFPIIRTTATVNCWDVQRLDEHKFHSAARTTVLDLPSFRSSVLPYVRPEKLKLDLNRQFSERFPFIRVTLSKIRSTKHKMLNICKDGRFEKSSCALAFILLHQLLLKKRSESAVGHFVKCSVTVPFGDNLPLSSPPITDMDRLALAQSTTGGPLPCQPLPKVDSRSTSNSEHQLRVRALDEAQREVLHHVAAIHGPQSTLSNVKLSELLLADPSNDMDAKGMRPKSQARPPITPENFRVFAACCLMLATKFNDRRMGPLTDEEKSGQPKDAIEELLELISKVLGVVKEEVLESEFLVLAELEFSLFRTSAEIADEYSRIVQMG